MKHLAIYGACGGILILAMRFIEYRFLVVSHSFEIYAALIAATFAALGIWFGLTITGRTKVPKVLEVPKVPKVPKVPEVPEVPKVLGVLGVLGVREVPEVLGVPVRDVAKAEPFKVDAARIAALGITPRELEVLQLIAEGLSNKEMAERMFVSENTVKTHASRVFDKLGASRRTQAVQFAKNHGLIA